MQILGPDEGALPNLPQTPILERFLFEAPTLPVAVLAIAALVALAMALKRQRKAPGLIVAGVLALLAVGVFVTAARVTTERERLAEHAARLVAAVASSDVGALRALLVDPVRIGPSDNATGWASRIPRITSFEQLEGVMSNRFGDPGTYVGSHQVLETRAALDGPGLGRTLVRVRVRGVDDAFISHSWWEIRWIESTDGWLASRIEAIWIQG